MPFAVTCPKCSARYRSKAERPLGKGVECPGCGERFYVSADNQAERGAAPPPAKRRPIDDEAEPRRRPAGDRDEADEGPPRRRGRRTAVFAILGAVALVFCLGGGGGAYFLFFSGGVGTEAPSRVAKRIKPPRDLPMELFAYSPSKTSNLDYFNLSELRQVKPLSATRDEYFKDKLPAGTGITLADIDAYCIARPGLYGGPQVTTTTLRMTAPRAAADVAARAKFKPLPVGTTQAYETTAGFRSTVLFQPAPDRLVFVRFDLSDKVDMTMLGELVGRTAATAQLPADTLECLREVSGYPVISFLAGRGQPGDDRGDATGRAPTADGVVEQYNFRFFASPGAAAVQTKMSKGIMLPQMKQKDVWVKGERYYMFTVETPQSHE